MRFAQLLWHISLVCTGIMSGFIVAFAIAIMPGLSQMASLPAVRSMNAINSAIGSSPLFFILFGGTGLVHVLGLAVALKNRQAPSFWLVICAAAIYLCGVLFVTLRFNIPMNKEMAEMDAAMSGNDPLAREILTRWIFWNRIRAVSSLISVLLLAFCLFRRGES